jgi:transposase
VSQRTGVINQIRAFMRNAGSPCARVSASCARNCPPSLRRAPMPLSPRMLRVIEELAGDWRRLDQRIDGLSGEIEALARQD